MIVKDKSLIWDDCPACAFKHLAGAVAALTAGSAPIAVPAVDVMRARAYIALGEAEAGYTGNAALAAGCLAVAESLCDDWQDARELRESRLRIGKCGVHEARMSLTRPYMYALAAGHFTEALRELPALSERVGLNALGGDGFRVTNREEFLDLLRVQIKWVQETYELGVK